MCRWIDLEAHASSHLEILAERFQFHPLTIEDCSHFDQRPKLEEYEGYLFLVTHGFAPHSKNAATPHALELHIFLSERYLVTVHAEPIPGLESVWKRLQHENGLARKGLDFVCYLVVDSIVDTFFPLLDQITSDVEDIESQVLRQGSHVKLADIFRRKRLLVRLRKILGPQRDVFALLSKRGEGWVADHTALYFRNVYDHVLRIYESVESTRDLLSNTLDAYLWSASQRTNEIMKRLTLLNAVFLPLAFITGFFGQNFEGLPFDSRPLFFAMLLSCAIVPAAMLYFFLRSRWF
jgi:magnesium transporter